MLILLLFLFTLVLITVILWNFEKKYNLFYRLSCWFNRISYDFRGQTKLKIDIFKSVFLVIIFGLISYFIYLLLYDFYFPYFENVWNVNKDDVFFKSFGDANNKLINNYFIFSDLVNDNIRSVENTYSSQIGDWGTFGDFIGGTLNPIIGLISIILLVLTLISSKRDQIRIQGLQYIQQFDTIFFSMIQNLNKVYDDLLSTSDKKETLKFTYEKCFSSSYDTLQDRVSYIEDNALLRKYFLMLYQILKFTNKRINNLERLNKSEKDDLFRLYGNMIRASLDTKILQLLMLNVYERFPEYSNLLDNFRIFEHMDFRNHYNNHEYWNFPILYMSAKENNKAFGNSDLFEDIKKNTVLRKIFSVKSECVNQNYFCKLYLNDLMDKSIVININNREQVLTFRLGTLNSLEVRAHFKDGNNNLQGDIFVYKDKLLIKKMSTFYQIFLDMNGQLKLFIGEDEIKKFQPINSSDFYII